MDAAKTKGRAIGPLGTISRLLLGPMFIYFGFNSPIASIISSNEIYISTSHWDDLIVGVVIFPALLAAWQLIRQKFKPERLKALGSAGTCINTIMIIALFYTPLHHAMWFYLGVSLLVAAIRGYAGCEVLAISNWVTGRDDQVGCIVLSPIDAIAKKESKKV